MVATRRVTVDEVEAMAFDGPWELIDGELIEVSPSADESASTGAVIVYLLLGHVLPRRLGRVYGADGGFVLFPDRQTVLVPDAAFVAADRAPRGRARKRFPRLAPDLAVEVLSPTDRMAEAHGKVALYLEAGVRLVWLVDPDKRTVTIFRPDAPPETLDATMTIDGGDVLPGFAVQVAEFFV
jgi:Uma2 family endonuclease